MASDVKEDKSLFVAIACGMLRGALVHGLGVPCTVSADITGQTCIWV
jgi:hypothetical protein